MEWETIGRPGFFGKKKREIFEGYTQKYGKENWRIMWTWNDIIIPWIDACLIYEDAYFEDSKEREDLWQKLILEAKDVYDFDKSNIESKLKYEIQEGPSTHIQDITIRRVVLLRRGWQFKGNKLIQIRSHKSYWGEQLSPGKVKFHLPELITEPQFEGDYWWDFNSVEDFYQRHKVLQVKK